MAGFSTSLANAIISATLSRVAFPAIRTPYFALFTADPTDAFTAGTEVAATWYQRVATGGFAAPNNGEPTTPRARNSRLSRALRSRSHTLALWRVTQSTIPQQPCFTPSLCLSRAPCR